MYRSRLSTMAFSTFANRPIRLRSASTFSRNAEKRLGAEAAACPPAGCVCPVRAPPPPACADAPAKAPPVRRLEPCLAAAAMLATVPMAESCAAWSGVDRPTAGCRLGGTANECDRALAPRVMPDPPSPLPPPASEAAAMGGKANAEDTPVPPPLLLDALPPGPPLPALKDAGLPAPGTSRRGSTSRLVALPPANASGEQLTLRMWPDLGPADVCPASSAAEGGKERRE